MAGLFVAARPAQGTAVLRAGSDITLPGSKDGGGAELLPGSVSPTAGADGAFGVCAWFGACARQARRCLIQGIPAAISAGARHSRAAPRAADGRAFRRLRSAPDTRGDEPAAKRGG